MTHPLVIQLRFARAEFVRCLDGVTEEEGIIRLQPMNCISWMVGHLASQENFYWNYLGQDKKLAPHLAELVAFGQPATTPPLADMWATWQEVTTTTDAYLDTLTTDMLENHFIFKGEPRAESIGTMLLRNLYHYWFHTGEAHAVRQQLGHTDLPQFVGNMESAFYRPE
ncbi:MAG: DinB family protein [Anaerolineae bacterium]|nr:DinB family protein [Anaerolineae bacterium]